MACIKNIGCFPSCEGILFPYEMLETGVHTISFEWLGVKKSFTVEGVEGEKMIIPNVFNESSDPVFSIKQPSGTYLCWDSTEEELAECPDDCGEDCEFYKKFTAEITDSGGTQQACLPDPGKSDQVFNIDSSQVIDNGNDTYNISVIGASYGALAFDELGNVYEYDGSTWTLKIDAASIGLLNIYTGDGTLAGNRTVTLDKNILQFIQEGTLGDALFKIDSAGAISFYSEKDGDLYGLKSSLVSENLSLWTGQSGLDADDDLYLKLITDAGVVEFTALPTSLEDVIAGTNITIDKTDPKNPIISSSGGGVSDHDSLNNLDYASSGHTGFEPAKGSDDNYVTDAEKIVIGNTSGTNTGDQDLSDYQLEPSEGAFVDGDKTKLDSALQSGDISDFETSAELDSRDTDNRNRANHTGTQTASTISDFDTEVENNSDVAANTAARHDALTVTDSSEIDLSLTGQDLTASIKSGSIDKSKLDASVNASLDLADSSIQDISGKEDAFSKNTGFNKDFGSTSGTVVEGDDSRLSDARTPTAHTHPASDLTATGGTSASYLQKNNTWSTPENTTYSEIPEAEITTGTASTLRTITARRLQFLLDKAVQLVGNQSINGIKTFLSFPVTPSSAPTTDYQVANKKYVDDEITGAGGYNDESAQDAVGGILTDSSEIDFTYDDGTPSISASIIAGSIDESKLDTSVNASLDLADSATQPADIADFETTTELNARDTDNRARANHTGTQTLSTISDAGTAAAEDVGTSAGNVVQLDGSSRLPAVDGSQLTNLPAEVNDLTSSVTWANVPDTNITESSVTQHEGALTITESQISDLDHSVDVVSNVATSTILGRVTGGSGNSEELTASQVRTLINVEDGADVTDTANVTAAGALMDSEVDADIKTLTLPANTTISAFGKTLVDDSDAATARTTLDVDQAGTDNSTNVSLAGSPNYLTIAGQVITRALINLTSHVTGILPVANGGTGASTLTGILKGNGTGAVTAVTAPTGAIVGTTDTQTLTNKRVTQRVNTITSSATPTPVGDTTDMFTVTALATNATFAAPTGTPTNGQPLMIRIKDNGTSRTLGWNAIYRASTDFALPTATVISKTLYIQFIYNSADSKWDAVGLTRGF